MDGVRPDCAAAVGKAQKVLGLHPDMGMALPAKAGILARLLYPLIKCTRSLGEELLIKTGGNRVMLYFAYVIATLVGAAAMPAGCGEGAQPAAAPLVAPQEGGEQAAAAEEVAPPERPAAAEDSAAVAMDPPPEDPDDPIVDEPDPVGSSWVAEGPDGDAPQENTALVPPLNLTARDAGDEESVRLRWSVESANQLAFMIQRQHWWGEVWVDSEMIVAPPFPYEYTDRPGAGLWRYRIAAANEDGTSNPTEWAEVRVTSSWTTFTPSADTKIVYVSSSEGNDANDGLSPFTPKRTINAGRALLRTGYPDWILFKRGDTFSETGWEVGGYGGRSDEEPQLWGSYGDGPRPIFTPPPGSGWPGFRFNWSPSHVAVIGLHMRGEAAGGGSGILLIASNAPLSNYLFEDCFIEGFKDNINIQGSSSQMIRNVIIRRCIVVDAFPNGTAHSQGAFINNVDGLLIEECVFDHNGWRNLDRSDATIFNHNLYISSGNSPNSIIRRNIIARASSHGLQLRCGGIIEENLFLLNPIAAQLGGGDPNTNTHVTGITGSMTGNVVLHGSDIGPGAERGMGLLCYNIGLAGATIQGNIIAHNSSASSTNDIPIYLWTNSYGCGVGNNNVTISENIIYNWRGGMLFNPPVASPPSPSTFTSFTGVVMEGNDIQLSTASRTVEIGFAASPAQITIRNNCYWSALPEGQQLRYNSTTMGLSSWIAATGDSGSMMHQVSYADPSRTIESYHAAIGGPASAEEFLSAARLQGRGSWRPEYTAAAAIAYFRDGFVRTP